MVKRVLIVDDHEPFRAIARELLEAAGYVVSGEAADARKPWPRSQPRRRTPCCSTCSFPTATDSRSRRRSRPRRAGRRAHLLARGGGLRPADRGLRRARLHREVEALGGGVRRPGRVMSSTARHVLADARARSATRCCSRRQSWSRVSASDGSESMPAPPGTRVAADLALSWALVAASLVVLERPRWRRARGLLAVAPHSQCWQRICNGRARMPVDARLPARTAWVALLVQLVLTFPEGRAWSRVAGGAIAAAYLATLGRAARRCVRAARLPRRALRDAAADGRRRRRSRAGDPVHRRRARRALAARAPLAALCADPHDVRRRRCWSPPWSQSLRSFSRSAG